MDIERHLITDRADAEPIISRVVAHGDRVYVCGITGDPVGDVTAQSRQALGRIDELLAQAGTDKSKLLSANIWITDMAKFAEMNAVWDAWVSPGNTPARATVEAKLAAPGYHVEMMVVAAK
jgi:enamine deaminase RidA (YjgF/YER057c/UK114 family)